MVWKNLFTATTRLICVYFVFFHVEKNVWHWKALFIKNNSLMMPTEAGFLLINICPWRPFDLPCYIKLINPASLANNYVDIWFTKHLMSPLSLCWRSAEVHPRWKLAWNEHLLTYPADLWSFSKEQEGLGSSLWGPVVPCRPVLM